MQTLYLIDGHAQFFRAFHAIRTPMSSPVTKEPTNATFGFVGMLLRVLRELKPPYLAVAIDVSGDRETFRSELYAEYKATRTAAPEALGPQIERCIAVLRALEIPVLGVPGYEADDVLATITERVLRERPDDLRVRLVSKDKDLQQLLIEGRVEMYDVHTQECMDVAKLREEKGITPAQVVDMLALMGDTVDNVPGVDGVGPKTAAELIAQWGTLENLAAHATEVKGKRGEKLREALAWLPLSKQLVTLRRDVPLEFEFERAAVERFPLARLLPILRELGFNRYQDEVRAILAERGEAVEPGGGGDDVRAAGPEASSSEAAPAPTVVRRRAPAEGVGIGGLFQDIEAARVSVAQTAGRYECVRTTKQLEALMRRLRTAEVVSFDTETTGLSPLRAHLCGVSLAVRAGEAWYVPVRSPDCSAHLDERTVLGALAEVLSDPAVAKCGHNLKYDMLVLRRHGVEVRGGRGKLFDSMVASYLIDSSRSSHALDALCLGLLGHTNIAISELIGSGKHQRTFDCVPLEAATNYAAEDADMSLRLRELMLPQLRAMGLLNLFDELEMPLVEALAELEWNGIVVDPGELGRQAARLRGRIDELRSELDRAAPRPFNPDSPRQLAEILFNSPGDEPPGLGIKPLKKTKTGYSTDVEVLEKLAADPAVESPVPGLIVEHRQLTKLVGTYLEALREEINPETGRIHASFNQTVAATGRLSSSDPNLQNIPIRTDIGREIRKAFVAPPGRVLISADYSQIELRLLAHLSRDPALAEAFDKGEDIHTAVAAQIHGVRPDQVTREQRSGAKMVNFGIVYGITAFGLARRLGIENDAAAQIIDGYKRRFAGITTFLEECIAQARRYGYVETILKRRRPIAGIESRNPAERSLAERVAINSVVQGSAADLIKVAMVNLHALLGERASHRRDGRPPALSDVRMLLQIHDELVFEAPERVAAQARALIVEHMESAMKLTVPVRVDSAVSRDWFEGH
ncbi:MAG: DNA polymerase I [Planctomycetota bacterium]|nr:DNA polymerase I [Planctomycetota bacterium]